MWKCMWFPMLHHLKCTCVAVVDKVYAIGYKDVVEPLTAGIIPHQVESPYTAI